MAEIIRSNNSLQTIKVSQNLLTTVGIVKMLEPLKINKRLVKLHGENNKIIISRRLLALIGDMVVYHNNTLRELILTCHSNSMLRDEIQSNSGEEISIKPEPLIFM